MALQAAKDFIEKVKNHKDLQKAISDAPHNVLGIGKEHGHEFTRAEIHQAMREKNMQKPDGGDYDDDDPDTCCV